MLPLFDALYQVNFDGDLTAYLQPEEREDYQMASRHQREVTRELTQSLTGRERALLESLLRNQEETREEDEDEGDELFFETGSIELDPSAQAPAEEAPL